MFPVLSPILPALGQDHSTNCRCREKQALMPPVAGEEPRLEIYHQQFNCSVAFDTLFLLRFVFKMRSPYTVI